MSLFFNFGFSLVTIRINVSQCFINALLILPLINVEPYTKVAGVEPCTNVTG